MKHIRKPLLSLTLSMLIAFMATFTLAPAVVHADTAKEEVCQGVGLLSGSGCSTTGAPDPNSIVATVVNILSIVVGIIAVIMIIIGGIRFVLSGGDSGATNSARNTVLYALVGLVIAALAQVLVRFVLNKL